MTLPTSPSLEVARTELAQLIETARTAWNASTPPWALPAVESENRNLVDLGSPEAQKPFLSWDIAWGGGGQVSLGLNPLGRQYGQLRLAAKIKAGSGSAECYKLLDFVIPYVELRDGTIVRIQAASVQDGKAVGGWYGCVALFTFWVDRVIVSAP